MFLTIKVAFRVVLAAIIFTWAIGVTDKPRVFCLSVSFVAKQNS